MSARKKRSPPSLFHLVNDSKGNITLTILLGIIIVGAIFLVSGIFPHLNTDAPDPKTPIAVPITDNQPITINKNSLQLKSIRFQTCSNDSAIAFLVDVSGSMAYGDKIGHLKDALNTFSSKLTDNTVIGLYSFSNDPQELLPFSYFKDVKASFPTLVSSLHPIQSTYTRRAFEFIKPKIEAAFAQFPQYKFTLIFISDGVPQSNEFFQYCLNSGLRSDAPPECKLNCKLGTSFGQSIQCFSPDQDPTTPPSIAQSLKDEGVQIYSIAILDQSDDRFNTQLQQLMKNVASPDSFFISPTGQDLSDIVSKIGTKLCTDLN